MEKRIIYVIILNYNNAEDTIECLKSTDSLEGEMVYRVVVDNGSDSECISVLREFINSKSNAILIETNENLGYAAGNNVGIKYAIENGADYIAILNNDVIVNKESFADSISILEKNEDVAFVGPVLLQYGTMNIQYAGGKLNYWKMSIKRMKSGEEYKESEEHIDCDYVGGACLIFRPSIVNKIGYIPELYFLFWEETEWCAKAIKNGMKCICTLKNYVHHKGSATVNRNNELGAHYLERNTVIFSRRNDSNGFRRLVAFIYINIRTVLRGIVRDKRFLRYPKYYFEGLRFKLTE